VTAARKVAVLGSVVRDQLFGFGADATGETVASRISRSR
jgi:hypothetical protein